MGNSIIQFPGTGGGIPPVPEPILVSFDEFQNLSFGNDLKVGVAYSVEYRSSWILNDTAQSVVNGSVERLVVTPVVSNQRTFSAVSEFWPSDVIEFTILNKMGIPSDFYGLIERRVETGRAIDVCFDWRAIYYRRYETVPGSGDFSICFDNGGAFINKPVLGLVSLDRVTIAGTHASYLNVTFDSMTFSEVNAIMKNIDFHLFTNTKARGVRIEDISSRASFSWSEVIDGTFIGLNTLSLGRAIVRSLTSFSSGDVIVTDSEVLGGVVINCVAWSANNSRLRSMMNQNNTTSVRIENSEILGAQLNGYSGQPVIVELVENGRMNGECRASGGITTSGALYRLDYVVPMSMRPYRYVIEKRVANAADVSATISIVTSATGIVILPATDINTLPDLIEGTVTIDTAQVNDHVDYVFTGVGVKNIDLNVVMEVMT